MPVILVTWEGEIIAGLPAALMPKYRVVLRNSGLLSTGSRKLPCSRPLQQLGGLVGCKQVYALPWNSQNTCGGRRETSNNPSFTSGGSRASLLTWMVAPLLDSGIKVLLQDAPNRQQYHPFLLILAHAG